MKEFVIFGLKYIKNYRVFGTSTDINGIPISMFEIPKFGWSSTFPYYQELANNLNTCQGIICQTGANPGR